MKFSNAMKTKPVKTAIIKNVCVFWNAYENIANGGISMKKPVIPHTGLESAAVKVFLSILLFQAVFFAAIHNSCAAVTQTINYQGYLVNKLSNLPVDSPQDINFVLYASPSGVVPLFTESRCDVPVSKGRYEVEVGSATAGGIPASVFGNNPAVWLEIQIDPDANCSGTYESLTPRIRLQAAPYAFEALHASTASSVSAGAINASDQIVDGIVTLDKLNASSCFNGAVPKFNGSAWVCGTDDGGSSYTADEASLHLQGSVFSALPSSVTLQGNIFNLPDTLVRLDSSGRLPAADGSLVLSISSVAFGTINNAGQIDDGVITLAKLNQSGCALDEMPKWNGTVWVCSAASGVTDPTKVLKAGDSMTGPLTLIDSTLTVTGNAFSVGTSTLVINAGRIGMGTTSPAALLTLSNGRAQFLDDGGNAPASGLGVEISYQNALGGTILSYNRNTLNYLPLIIDGDPLALNANNGVRVGIGTLTPGAILDVQGDAWFGSISKSSFSADGSLILASGRNITVSGGGELLGLPATPSGDTAAVSKAYADSLSGGANVLNTTNTWTAWQTYLNQVTIS
ncbi:MAG: hypothetical protein ABIG11_02830, partial [bacterium]